MVSFFAFREPAFHPFFEVEASFRHCYNSFTGLYSAASPAGTRIGRRGGGAGIRGIDAAHALYGCRTFDLEPHVKAVFKRRFDVLVYRGEFLLCRRWRGI